jgi:Predicted esterase of the alpha-beta hydrolase superfamily
MDNTPKKKIGLALSGGGYRAAAYHIGTLRALNRLGILDNIDVISSVSGGSITAAYYALHKDDYDGFERSFIEKLQKGVMTGAIINLTAVILLIVLSVWCLGWWILFLDMFLLFFFCYQLLPLSFWITRAYNKSFFKKAKLSDLPAKPLLAINSTNVTTGTLFTFSQGEEKGESAHKNEATTFNYKIFPVATAVMASSCVPFAFSPIKIGKKYYTGHAGKRAKRPLLIDGGLYDNQGAHKLSEGKSRYHAQRIIVSDAGVGVMNEKWAFNILLMLVKTSNIMMRRIKTFQKRNNIYSKRDVGVRYAYVSLEWGESEPGRGSDYPVQRFVNNILKEHIAPELYRHHSIKEEDVADLKSKSRSIRSAASLRLTEHLKQNIKWRELEAIRPTKDEYNTAKAVGTNLTSLRKRQIDALIKHSNWLAELHIRLYLPYLITKSAP